MVDGTAQHLPGFEPPARPEGRLVAAVRSTFDTLDDLGLVKPEHAAVGVLALTMAEAIESKVATGRMSTLGNDARVLMDLINGLIPAPAEDGGVDDELREAMDAWTAAVKGMTPG